MTSNKSHLPQAEPSEAVSALLSPAPSEVFSFGQWKHTAEGPKLEKRQVRIRQLRLSQIHEAIAAAQRYAKEKNDAAEHRDIYREEQAVQIAWRCLCYPDIRERPDGTQFWQPLYASDDHLRNSLTETEIAQVLNMYELVKAKFGQLEPFSDDEIDMWAARLTDAVLGEHFLALLDSSHWPALLLSLAREVQSLRAEVGRPLSTSLPSSESSPENSDLGTGEFTELPPASSSDGELKLPTDRLLTKSDAQRIVRDRRRKGAK